MIDQLPVEIISFIFSLCLRPIESRSEEDEDEEKDETRLSPLTLGGVCRSWRHIAWSTPEIWVSLSFTIKVSITEDDVTFYTEWLKRSRELPLYIRLDATDQISRANGSAADSRILERSLSLIDHLNENSHRWHTLILNLPPFLLSQFSDVQNNSPKLHTLVIRRTWIFGTSYPPLRITQAAPRIGFKWEHLLHLSAEVFTVEEALVALRNAPQLLRCAFRFPRFSTPSNSSVAPPASSRVTCTKLLSIHLSTPRNPNLIRFFLDNVTFPSLKKFLISQRNQVIPMASLSSFLIRSCCPLQELIIRSVRFLREDDLVNIVRLVPQLNKLILHFTHMVEHDRVALAAFYKALSNHLEVGDLPDPARSVEPLLPHLQHLELLGDSISFPARLITGLFAPLQKGRVVSEPNDQITSANQRPIKFVRLFLNTRLDLASAISHIDLESLHEILRLQKDNGVEFDLRFSFRDHPNGLIDISRKFIEENGGGRENVISD